MNPNTRVVVCCYAGDAHQINMPAMLRHECPVTLLSPEDAPVSIEMLVGNWNSPVTIDCKFGGKAAYIGQDSLDRQIEHFKILLTYPEQFFLLHDSDSVLLDAKIPDYLYAEPGIVWSNQVDDAIPEHQATFPEGWPHVAFQPPYFISRDAIEKMVAVADDPRVKATPMMPFIDYFMVQLTVVAGLPWQRLMDCVSCPIAADPRKTDVPPHHHQTLANGYQIAMQAVLIRGAVFAHSIKNPVVVDEFLQARQQFLAGNPNPVPRSGLPPRVGGGPRHPSHRQGRHRAFTGPDTSGLKA